MTELPHHHFNSEQPRMSPDQSAPMSDSITLQCIDLAMALCTGTADAELREWQEQSGLSVAYTFPRADTYPPMVEGLMVRDNGEGIVLEALRKSGQPWQVVHAEAEHFLSILRLK